MNIRRGSLIVGCLGVLIGGAGYAEEKASDSREPDRAAIRAASQAFSKAFGEGNAKTVAAFWTEEGEYISDDGTRIHGREAIEKAFSEYFKKNTGARMEVEITSIRFVSPDTAIEDGYLKLHPAGALLPTSTRYSTLHVRQEGKWKMALAREWAVEGDHLRDLEWLIGGWSTKIEEREIHMEFEWNAKKTFIKSRYTVKKDGKVATSFTQVIGRDPVLEQIRSWVFEDEGGIGYGLWSRDGSRWDIQSAGVLADGTEYSAENSITRLDANTFIWRSTDREVGGESLADTAPVKVTRIKSDR